MKHTPAVFRLLPGRAAQGCARVALGMMFWSFAVIFVAASDCNPELAPELLAVTITNSGSVNLRDYPVAIAFDQTIFDFTQSSRDGSEVDAWDPRTGEPLPHWLESYDPVCRKGPAVGGAAQAALSTFAHDLADWRQDSPLSGAPRQRLSGLSIFQRCERPEALATRFIPESDR